MPLNRTGLHAALSALLAVASPGCSRSTAPEGNPTVPSPPAGTGASTPAGTGEPTGTQAPVESQRATGHQDPVRDGVRPSAMLRETLTEITRAGIRLPQDMVLPDERAWQDLRIVWEGMTRRVRAAKKVRTTLAKKLTKDARAKGDAKEFLGLGYPKPATGSPETRPWKIRNHPNEWVSVQTTYDAERKTQVHRVVRIPPGASRELDDANTNIAVEIDLRSREIRRFVAMHNAIKSRRKH